MTRAKMIAVLKGDDNELQIGTNKDGLVNATDLWKRAGSPENKRPKDWLGTKDAIEFVDHITNLTNSNCRQKPLLESKAGRYGKTYLDIQLALKYAQYLSPHFQFEVNEVYLERKQEERDPELGIERAINRHTKQLKNQGRDDEFVEKRLKGIFKRTTLTSTLQSHGVVGDDRPWLNGYVQVTNATYVGLTGKKAQQLREEYQVAKGENLRDKMSSYDIDTLAFIECTLEHKIKEDNIYGNAECAQMAHKISKNVKKLVDDLKNGNNGNGNTI